MPAFSAVAGTTWNTTAGSHTVVATPAVGDLIVIIAGYSGGTASSGSVSDNNGGGTYTKAVGCVQASGARTLECFVRDSLIGSATSTTFTQDDPPGADTGGGLHVLRITGCTDSGTSIIVQVASQDSQAAAGTPTPVFGATTNTNNMIIGAVINASTTATLTPRVNFTERVDTGYTTPATGLETMSRDSGEVGTSMAWGGTSPTAFGDFVIEIKAAGTHLPVPMLVAPRR